jgi:hypothetical protein
MRFGMSTFKKWAQRGVIAVLVVWLIWLTTMQFHLYIWTQPLSESDMLKEMVALQEESSYLETQIQALQEGKPAPAPIDQAGI